MEKNITDSMTKVIDDKLDGMDEVILKPVSPDMIEGVVRRFFAEGMAGIAL